LVVEILGAETREENILLFLGSRWPFTGENTGYERQIELGTDQLTPK
jgi:hypothetical protein